MVRNIVLALGVCLLWPGSAGVLAQTAPPRPPAPTGKLIVTVADASGAVIANATVTVTVTGSEAPGLGSKDPALQSASTTAAGVATIDGLVPGRYTVTAEFAGFEKMTIKDYRVRAGDNRRTVTLPVKKISEELSVKPEARSDGLDPRGNAFSTVLTREQIAALPDDPDEMEAALKAMSPPGAMMRIDGFSGGRLPPKSQIRSIRLPRMDQLAAQNHGGVNGMMFIDVMTQPGHGPLAGSFDFAFRDDAMNARNPFTPSKADEGLMQGGLSFSGSIVPNKSSFSIVMQPGRAFDTGSILAATTDGTLAASVRRPAHRASLNARFDQAFGQGHMLRLSYQQGMNRFSNQGVGGFDLEDRAFSTTSSDRMFRMSENGAIGRRFFSESRLQARWSEAEVSSGMEAPTIRVLDAFTAGGAQRRGGSRNMDFEAASDLDYVRGVHSLRAGVLVEGGRYRSTDSANYLGTYTFASLADYEAGRPLNYSRRLGNPNVSYSNLQVGAYVQDDYRFAKSMLLSYGLRYEAQTLIGDSPSFSPRATLTWSPFKSGRTNLRLGAGRFRDWFGLGTYEQTLRVDGVRQQELNILNPLFPDPGAAGSVLPSNRYQLASDIRLPAAFTANAGVDQSITPAWRMSATYTYREGSALVRGRNLNAPIGGVRPDPAFANVIEVVNDAASRLHMAGFTMSYIRLDWKQTFIAGNYTFSAGRTNTTGPFSIPANGDDLSTEWGPASPRHRVAVNFNMQPIPGVSLAMNARAQSGSPYTITTGDDANQDGVFNDRPAGVGRNSATTAAQWDIGLRVAYTIGFGQRTTGPSTGGPTVVMIGGPGGGMPGGMGSGGAQNKRYRIEVYAAVQNVTNRNNLVGYSGVLTSPFFGQPTNVLNPRKVEVGTRFVF